MTLKEAALYLDSEMKKDLKAGKKWTYTNKKAMGKSFEESRASKYYRVNCNAGVIWCCIKAGIFEKWPGNFYFNKSGNLVAGASVKAEVLKKFDDLGDQNINVKTLIKNGTLKPGDIVGYHGMYHTNLYLGDNKWFDSGHVNCSAEGEGAPFTCFVSGTKYGNSIVGHILRPKVQEPEKKTTYRVQVGSYSVKENAEKRKTLVKDKTGLTCFISTEGDQFKVFCGSFTIKANAEKRVKELKTAKIAAILKTY